MPNWQRVESIAGETAREIGILIVVFAPLEATFSEVSVSSSHMAAMLLIGFALIAGGIILETRK